MEGLQGLIVKRTTHGPVSRFECAESFGSVACFLRGLLEPQWVCNMRSFFNKDRVNVIR